MKQVSSDSPQEEAFPPWETFDDDLPSRGLLSFYDGLRVRVVEALEKRGGRFGGHAADTLLLVPDVFVLLVRIALDKEVPKDSRKLVASALAYFVLPLDLFPEAVVGGIGFTDDLVLALAVLTQAMSGDLEPFAEKYWSGSERLRVIMRDVLVSADRLLGNNLYERVKALLRKRGVELDEEASPSLSSSPQS